MTPLDATVQQPNPVTHYFQSTAGDWRRIYSNQDVHGRLYQQRRDEVIAMAAGLALPAGCRVLDVGCGPGLIAVRLAQRGWLVDAVDSAPEMVAMTSALAAGAQVSDRVQAKVADILNLAVEDDSFELVVAVGVTEWVANLDAALNELYRVLKPGGFLIATSSNRWSLNFVCDPLKSPLISPLKKAVRGLLPERAICHHRSYAQMKSFVERAGFQLVRGRRFGFGPFTSFGRRILPHELGWKVHCRLQQLADANWPILRSTAHVHITLARKPVHCA